MMKSMKMKSMMVLIAAATFTAAGAMAQVETGIPNTGIGPAPTGVVPGSVVPVPAPNTTPTSSGLPLPVPVRVPSPIGVNPVPPIPGGRPNGTATLNTFSEQQVRSNLMAQGYSGVSGLTSDGSGTWHGTAVRNGANVSVTMDANGMVTSN